MGRRRPARLAVPLVTQPPPLPPTPSPLTPIQAPPNTPTPIAGVPPLPAAGGRRQPVLLSRPAPSRGARCAEVAGGAAADCAAVCCCCPCGIINLLVLAIVKLPAGLCRQACRKKRKKLKASGKGGKKDGDISVGSSDAGSTMGATTRRVLLGPRAGNEEEQDDDEFIVLSAAGPVGMGPASKNLLAVAGAAAASPSPEISEMDKKMWAYFYGTGFWRSPSQKDT